MRMSRLFFFFSLSVSNTLRFLCLFLCADEERAGDLISPNHDDTLLPPRGGKLTSQDTFTVTGFVLCCRSTECGRTCLKTTFHSVSTRWSSARWCSSTGKASTGRPDWISRLSRAIGRQIKSDFSSRTLIPPQKNIYLFNVKVKQIPTLFFCFFFALGGFFFFLFLSLLSS